MIDQIFKYTTEYNAKVSAKSKKDKGQYFTSKNTALYMGKWDDTYRDEINILDPGAGNGSLGASVIEYIVDNRLCKKINLTYVENDIDVIPVLKQTISDIKALCKDNNINCNIQLIEANFILFDFKDTYDLIICNPPYKKIRKDSEESAKMKEYVYGQPNLYALFMIKGIELLKDGGSYIFITPRSWTSGTYFSVIRSHIMDNLSFDKIHVFDRRDKSFTGEVVLQEAMILFASKKPQSEEIEISISPDDSFNSIFSFKVSADTVKGFGKDKFLLVPSNNKEPALIKKMKSFPETFSSLGYTFKTGPVVEFRNEEFISTFKDNDSVPMYRSANINSDTLLFPANTTKAQYVSSKATNLLVPNQNTVLVKRLTAKEENKRIQSCVYYKQGSHPYISIENHVNYVVRKDGKPMTAEEVEWIHQILNSCEYDAFFRLLNGSTQINANELNLLPVNKKVS